MGIGSTGRAIGKADKVLGTNLQSWFYVALILIVLLPASYVAWSLGLIGEDRSGTTEAAQTYDQAAAAAAAKAAARDAQAKAARDAR